MKQSRNVLFEKNNLIVLVTSYLFEKNCNVIKNVYADLWFGDKKVGLFELSKNVGVRIRFWVQTSEMRFSEVYGGK